MIRSITHQIQNRTKTQGLPNGRITPCAPGAALCLMPYFPQNAPSFFAFKHFVTKVGLGTRYNLALSEVLPLCLGGLKPQARYLPSQNTDRSDHIKTLEQGLLLKKGAPPYAKPTHNSQVIPSFETNRTQCLSHPGISVAASSHRSQEKITQTPQRTQPYQGLLVGDPSTDKKAVRICPPSAALSLSFEYVLEKSSTFQEGLNG